MFEGIIPNLLGTIYMNIFYVPITHISISTKVLIEMCNWCIKFHIYCSEQVWDYSLEDTVAKVALCSSLTLYVAFQGQ